MTLPIHERIRLHAKALVRAVQDDDTELVVQTGAGLYSLAEFAEGSHGYTPEQAKAADRLADIVASVSFIGNGPDGAIIARGDLTRLAAALDEYRNAKRDGGPHAQ